MTQRRMLLGETGYRRLFTAQVAALVGTGLLTVALSLLAYDVAPSSAGSVVATALTIKIVAYVALAPAVTVLTAGMRPRVVLVGADVGRFLVAAALPWVDQVWQVYVLIFVLQAASATFTPTYQALLPTVLPRREDYTRALSYSRVAYDMEAVLSPLLAAAALLVVSYHALFIGTAAGFLASAVLVVRSDEGRHAVPVGEAPLRTRVTAGARMFATRPALRAIVALDLAASGATAMVLVNTVVAVRQTLGLGEDAVAVALAVFGAGSVVVALLLPRVLERRSERQVMLVGAGGVAATLGLTVAATAAGTSWPLLLGAWFLLGATGSAVLTPSGQVINDAVSESERPAAYAAHFSLSHAWYLIVYPIAGWVGAHGDLPAAALTLSGISAAATIVAATTWSPTSRRAAVAPTRSVHDHHPRDADPEP